MVLGRAVSESEIVDTASSVAAAGCNAVVAVAVVPVDNGRGIGVCSSRWVFAERPLMATMDADERIPADSRNLVAFVVVAVAFFLSDTMCWCSGGTAVVAEIL